MQDAGWLACWLGGLAWLGLAGLAGWLAGFLAEWLVYRRTKLVNSRGVVLKSFFITFGVAPTYTTAITVTLHYRRTLPWPSASALHYRLFLSFY